MFFGIKPGPAQQDLYSRHGDESAALPNNFDYILLPLTNGKYRESIQDLVSNADETSVSVVKVREPQLQDLCIPPFTSLPGHSPTKSNEKDMNSPPQYIGMLSSWLDLEDSDPVKREVSYQVLINECKYARFIGIRKLVLAPPREIANLPHYSQIINKLLMHDVISKEPAIILSVSLPLCEESDPLATWDLWNTLRKFCHYHKSLTISLAVPRTRTPTYVLNKWLCEPVSCLLVSSSIFALNQHEYPVLHKHNQMLILSFQKLNGYSQFAKDSELCVILHGMERYGTKIKGGEAVYLEYMNYLLKRGDSIIMKDLDGVRIPNAEVPRMMPPWQPHTKMLTNYDYSSMESDFHKYDAYGRAIELALVDLALEKKKLLIAVAGAGRGPLVTKTFEICSRLQLKVELFAIEKNPQAYLYLQKRNFEHWDGQAHLVQGDIATPGVLPKGLILDLCISELLGSFGCNELCPELLRNIEANHSDARTVFIPQSYTSYVAPVSSPLAHQYVRAMAGEAAQQNWILHRIPYLIVSSKINEVWTFSHGGARAHAGAATGAPRGLTRTCTSGFKVKHRAEIHGLVGFFEAALYGDVVVTTLPCDRQGGALVSTLYGSTGADAERDARPQSWSPFFFPLQESLSVVDDTFVSVMLARQGDAHRVWYEWSLESYLYLMVTRARRADAPSRGDAAAAEMTLAASVANLHLAAQDAPDPAPELRTDEQHLRIKTGTSPIHNAQGLFASLAF